MFDNLQHVTRQGTHGVRSIMHANRFMNPFMNRPWLFTSPHVNTMNGFRMDSRAHDKKSNGEIPFMNRFKCLIGRTHSLENSAPDHDNHKPECGTNPVVLDTPIRIDDQLLAISQQWKKITSISSIKFLLATFPS